MFAQILDEKTEKNRVHRRRWKRNRQKKQRARYCIVDMSRQHRCIVVHNQLPCVRLVTGNKGAGGDHATWWSTARTTGRVDLSRRATTTRTTDWLATSGRNQRLLRAISGRP